MHRASPARFPNVLWRASGQDACCQVLRLWQAHPGQAIAEARDRHSGNRQLVHAKAHSQDRPIWITGDSPADADPGAGRARRGADTGEKFEERGSERVLEFGEGPGCRSAALRYCSKSFVPTDTKSTCSVMPSIASAAAGTST